MDERKTRQDWPDKSVNVNSTDLTRILSGVSTIYVYPHHEILLNEEDRLEQTRSGPNWEGGIVTMTTCKHLMRTYNVFQPNSGEGKIALCGVTNKLRDENFLMYAGVVDKSFNSNYELGQYLFTHHYDAYQKKLATKNRLGDIFPEKYELDLDMEEQFDCKNFITPVGDHCRYEENDSKGNRKWIKDIEYMSRNGNRPQCVTLNPVTVHSTPMFEWTGKLGRSGRVFRGDNAVEEFMDNLIGAILL